MSHSAREKQLAERASRITDVVKEFADDRCQTIGHFEVVNVGDEIKTNWSILWDHEVDDLYELPEFKVAQVLAVLGSEVRLAMLRELACGPRTISQLVEVLNMKTTGQAHHHMKELALAGYVLAKKGGVYELNMRVARIYFVALALARNAIGEEKA